jgi:peptide deformylase
MPTREIVQIGNPLLREKARHLTESELGSATLQELVADMIDTMHTAGGIGIAAPQVGESLRVAVIEIDAGSSRYPDLKSFPLTVLVNPKVTVLDAEEQGYWEGCLSVPNLRGLVFRPRHVRVDYCDVEGKKHTIVAEGFLATVFQHELDHLDGILFLDKVRDTRRLATTDNYVRFWLEPSGRTLDI